MKKLFFLILFLFPLSLFAQASTVPDFEALLKSPYILTAEVQDVSVQDKNPQGNKIQLKVLEFLKGQIKQEKVLLFEETLFPNSVSEFSNQKKILVFLKDLPKYSSYQALLAQGYVYGTAFKSASLITLPADQEAYQNFIKLYLPYLEQNSDEAKLKKKEILISTLLQTSSQKLQGSLALYLEHFPQMDLNEEEAQKISQLVLNANFSELAKLSLVKYFSSHASSFQFKILRKFICISPDALCLQSAEVLENAKQGLSFAEYQKLLPQVSVSLQLGLLSILAKHQRGEMLSLFEERLKSWSDDKQSASLIEDLGLLGGSRAEELCLKYSQDSRYYVRMYSFSCLGELKSEKAIPLMEKVINKHDPAMLSVIAGALEHIGTPLALQTLYKYYEKGHHGAWEATDPKHFLPK